MTQSNGHLRIVHDLWDLFTYREQRIEALFTAIGNRSPAHCEACNALAMLKPERINNRWLWTCGCLRSNDEQKEEEQDQT